MKPNRYRYTGNKLYDFFKKECNNRDITLGQLFNEFANTATSYYNIDNSRLRRITYPMYETLCERYGIDIIAPLLQPWERYRLIGIDYEKHKDCDWYNDIIMENL